MLFVQIQENHQGARHWRQRTGCMLSWVPTQKSLTTLLGAVAILKLPSTENHTQEEAVWGREVRGWGHAIQAQMPAPPPPTHQVVWYMSLNLSVPLFPHQSADGSN